MSINKITIITPSYRIQNLSKIEKTIDFDYVDEWIIVYDGSKISEIPSIFNDSINKNKIKEFINNDKGISGNPQRNYGLSKVSNKNTLLYFLDDDNIIHPDLYDILKNIDKKYLYTFNQINLNSSNYLLKGNKIESGAIDTAMVLIPFKYCKDVRWKIDEYGADYYYIKECIRVCKNSYIYINKIASYYNMMNIVNCQ
jgi:hypothetical protein